MERHIIAKHVDSLLSKNVGDFAGREPKESGERLSYGGPPFYTEGLGNGNIGCLVRL